VRENLGYLPENVPLYTEMKVDEYLDFRGRLRKMDRAARKKRSTTSATAAGCRTSPAG
jgi:ABC-2 type transport system ATP-binding protein